MDATRFSALRIFAFFFGLCVLAPGEASPPRGLADTPSEHNLALLVGVSHGLPGIGTDINNMERIARHAAYGFETFRLQESDGTGARVMDELERLSAAVRRDGTLLIYYSGHGSPGSLYLQDGSFEISRFRGAIEMGRRAWGPMSRLVFLVDACYSGSLLDPLRLRPLWREDPRSASEALADAILRALAPGERFSYWKRLFVLASSRDDETSLAGKNGSVFTNAFVKAFRETERQDGTLEDLVSLAQRYTKGHHPVARFSPATLAREKLIP